MAMLRMLHRAAFIGNVCFLLALGILRLRHPLDPGLTSFMLITGFFVSISLNVVVNVWQMALRFSNKKTEVAPRWLRMVNGGFLAIQLILLLR